MDIHIVFPGEPVIKKGSAQTSFTEKKNGRILMRPTPIHYYTEKYKEWARKAVIACSNFKNLHTELSFPIVDKINMRCWFFLGSQKVVNLSGLLEVSHCVLCGKADLSYPPQSYQIIPDDNINVIGSFDGSRTFYDPVNPRTEIWHTPYKLEV